jgi:hypothetical protein
MTRALPHLPGTLTAAQVRATGEHIAEQQLPNGLIPWFDGYHADPWDHIEAAMALTVCGLDKEARRAYEWSAQNQQRDGTWPMEIIGHTARDASVDTNQVAYVAVGVWHYWQSTGRRHIVDEMWPVVRRAIDFVVDCRIPSGGIAWARDQSGVVSDSSLLTGNACILLSLRCAIALADLVGESQPDWELCAGQVAHAVAVHPDEMQDKSRYSMDWYYPVLGGALRGADARDHLHRRWTDFVVPGRGIRCVNDAPWVTAAETCELVLTLTSIGDDDRALSLFRDVQFLRADDGGYWTGWVWPEETIWPAERSTWTGAAVVLAADALAQATPGHGLFRGDGLPRVVEMGADDCDRRCDALMGEPT